MANYQTSFRQEVRRIARKEIRSELKSTKQAVSRYRSEIAALKRKHKELERLIKTLQSRAEKKSQAVSVDVEQPKRRRYSVGSLKSQRKKSGLSQVDYARLVGVSANTIHNWERGKTKPDDKHLQKLVSHRGIGKKEAQKRISDMKVE